MRNEAGWLSTNFDIERGRVCITKFQRVRGYFYLSAEYQLIIAQLPQNHSEIDRV